MATKVFDAVAITGKYTDRQGNEKKRYTTIGAVFENDKKQMSLKIESIPVGGEWNGWVSFYVPKEQGDKPEAPSKPAAQQASGGGSFDDFEDDIPFLFNMNTICDTMGQPLSLWRARYGKGLSVLRANKTDF